MTGGQKVLIWDFDKTLAQRAGGWSGALVDVLQRRAPQLNATIETVRPFVLAGFPWHAPENEHIGQDTEDWWFDLLPVFIRAFRGLGAPPALARELAAEVRPAYLDLSAWECYPDTLPALDALSARGWRHALLTNHVPELPVILAALNLDRRFARVFNSAETGVEKPNHKAFRGVMDWAGSGAAAWMIGDNYSADVLGAAEVGLSAILVRKAHPGAQYFCETLAGIERIVGSP